MKSQAIILSVLLTLLVFCSPSSAQDNEQAVTITVQITLTCAEIKNFTINPTQAYQNQDVEFTVTVKNTSTVPIHTQPTSKIEILHQGSLIDTLYFTSSTKNIPAGEEFDFILSWNTGNNPPGSYQAKVTVDYDNRTTSRVESFSIVERPAPPENIQPPPPVIVIEENLRFESFSPVLELEPGETKFMSVRLSNLRDTPLLGISIDVTAPDNRAVVIPRILNLGPGDNAVLNVQISVPLDAQPNDYGLRVQATHPSTGSRAEIASLLRVKHVPADRPSISRTVEVSQKAVTTRISIRVRNAGRYVSRFELVEEIKKEITPSIYEISFDPMPSEVIEPDPVVKWILEDMAPYEERIVSYTVPNIVAFDTYAYWPIKQLTVVYREVPHTLEIMGLEVPAMSPGGTTTPSLTVMNVDTIPHEVVVKLSPPTGWSVTPSDISATFAPRVAYILKFRVTCEPSATSGTYMGLLSLTCDKEEMTHYIVFYVREPALTLADYAIFVLIVVGGVLIYLGAREIFRRRGRGKAMKTLREVKNEIPEEW